MPTASVRNATIQARFRSGVRRHKSQAATALSAIVRASSTALCQGRLAVCPPIDMLCPITQ